MARQESPLEDVSSATRLLGRFGVWSNFDHLTGPELMAFAGRVEALGFDTLWLNEVSGREPFTALGALAVTTSRVTLGLGIASVYARDAAAAHAGALTLAELSGGRFVLGLGVSHAFHVETQRGQEYLPPLPKMRGYLDAYAAAPYRAPRPAGDPPVIVAALRRQMLRLAATRTDGAFPFLVPADYLARARQMLDQAAIGAGVTRRPTLVVAMAAVLQSDPVAARATARRWMERYLTLPNYRNNLLECGFDEEDVAAAGSDRLVDAVVAWGSAAEIRARIDACHAVGVDHVALIPLSSDGRQADVAVIEAVAG
jgi:probable F420-dependent oxidoreductase